MPRIICLVTVFCLTAAVRGEPSGVSVVVEPAGAQAVTIRWADDAEMDVAVSRGGRRVTVTDPRTRAEAVLENGVMLGVKFDEIDGLRAETDHFVLRQGKRILAEVSSGRPTGATSVLSPAVPTAETWFDVTVDTPTGQVRLSVREKADMDVLVRDGRKRVALGDNASKKEIPLNFPLVRKLSRPGEANGAAPPLEVELDAYTLKRGDQAIATVRFAPAAANAAR